MDRQFPEAEWLSRYGKMYNVQCILFLGIRIHHYFFFSIEYAALTRLGLGDPKSFCRKRFKDTSLLYLSSCCVGSNILGQIEAAIEEAISSQSWVEVLVSTRLSTKKYYFWVD
jgi:hypothetical protein